MSLTTAPRAPQVPLAAQIMEMASGVLVTQMISVLLRHEIAGHVRAGRRTARDLAAATGLPERGLYRLLRASTGLGLFARDGQGRFALTPLGEVLDLWTATEWGFDALRAFPEALATGRSGMEVAHGMTTFEYFERHPEAGATFDRLMQALNAGEQEAVAEAYDLAGVEVLVDVGGGNGAMLATLLAHHPGIRGVLFDQPSVVGRGAPALVAHAGRFEAIGGDFFQSVPEGADAYMLSHVLHDWPEDGCVRVLENCRDAMRPGGRVLVVEMVIPADDSPHPGRMSDMVMVAFNGEGMERTEAEYAELLGRAGFRLERVVPTASPVSVVEAYPR